MLSFIPATRNINRRIRFSICPSPCDYGSRVGSDFLFMTKIFLLMLPTLS